MPQALPPFLSWNLIITLSSLHSIYLYAQSFFIYFLTFQNQDSVSITKFVFETTIRIVYNRCRQQVCFSLKLQNEALHCHVILQELNVMSCDLYLVSGSQYRMTLEIN